MAKKPDKALEYLDKTDGMLNFDENVAFNYGLAQYQTGNYSEALKYFEKAIALDPTMVNAQIYAGIKAAAHGVEVRISAAVAAIVERGAQMARRSPSFSRAR